MCSFNFSYQNKTGIYICPGYVDGGDNCVYTYSNNY